MSLFVVKHRHDPDRCPAADPQGARFLLQHLSSESAAQAGVEIEGEGVVNGAHTLYLIVTADDKAAVDHYMAPFAQAGTLEVMAASPCEQVVSRGSC